MEVGVLKYENLPVSYCVLTGPNYHSDYYEVDSEVEYYEYELDDEEIEFVKKYIELVEYIKDASDKNYVISESLWIKYYDKIKEMFENKVSVKASKEIEERGFE